MRQDSRVDLPTSLGYLLKEASAALRTSMEAVLRPLGMTVTHYACLELLAQRPGLSNSELARGTFVTRQSMNVLLQALEEDGVVIRPAQPASGRALPTALTARGRRQLEAASAAVRAVELQMISGLTLDEQDHLRALLSRCVSGLGAGTRPPTSESGSRR
jgi:DNA-binding MarR family transcriptional regulator